MKIESASYQIQTRELIPQIVNRIFLICKSDNNFKLKDEMQIVENKIKSLEAKIEKQEDFLRQANELKDGAQQRLQSLENQNQRKQIELLEQLGSDL